jgi:hydrogenase nickel incorporation protein HypA/HybF
MGPPVLPVATHAASGKRFMHEMGIAMQIIEIASASIPQESKPVRVERVNLKIGKLAAVVPESLRFCFEIASRETPLDGAELCIEEIPVVARCNGCGEKWTIDGPAFSCPACNSGKIDILSGRELNIESIEVADEDGNREDPRQ